LGVLWAESHGPGKLLLEIYEKTTEGELWGPVFVCDYPWRCRPWPAPTARRRAWSSGSKPSSPGENWQRLQRAGGPGRSTGALRGAGAAKAAGDEEAMAVDEDYLRPSSTGFPPPPVWGSGSTGLVMLLADVSSIRDVVLFPTLRPLDQ